MEFATRAIHVGQDPDPTTGATIVPIYQTSTYTQAAPHEQLYAGLRRYWDKRPEAESEAESSARSAPAEPSTHAGRSPRQGGGA